MQRDKIRKEKLKPNLLIDPPISFKKKPKIKKTGIKRLTIPKTK